ncbi:MAG: RDD family protein [Aaplasma endosymbiont of Hyalomma asiaticum]
MQKLVVASIFRRVLASVIDLGIASVAFLPVVVIFPGNDLILFLSFMTITCFYYHFSVKWQGSSVGQRLMGLLVVTNCGNSINTRIMLDRTVFQFLCPSVGISLMQIVSIADLGNISLAVVLLLQVCLTIFWGYWYTAAIFSPMKQTFHDLLCNTIVVVKSKQ